MVIRARLPEKVYEALRVTVGKGAPFQTRDGVPEMVVRIDDPTFETPDAVAVALRHARAQLDGER